MDELSALTVLRNIAASFEPLLGFLNAISYTLGALSALFAMFLLYQSGQPGNARESKIGWVWSLLVAVIFFALPQFISDGARQIFGPGAQDNPLAYAGAAISGPKLGALAVLLQLLGMIFAMRGLWVLRAVGIYGNHSQGGASFGKGFVMVIAGICLVNMRDLMQVVSGMTGLQVGAGLFY